MPIEEQGREVEGYKCKELWVKRALGRNEWKIQDSGSARIWGSDLFVITP